MRQIFTLFLVLNIYTAFYSSAQETEILLKITGSSPSETKAIDSIGYRKAASEFTILKNEVDSLKRKLQESGYVDIIANKIRKTAPNNYECKFSLGKKYEYLHLDTPKNRSLRNTLLDLDLTINSQDTIVIRTAFAKALLQQLSSQASKNGEPFTTFQIQHIKKEKDFLSGRLSISQERSRTIDTIVIQGYDQAPKSYIKHYAQIRKGQTFNTERIENQNNTLDNLPFIKAKKDPEILFTKDSTSVYLYLEKEQNNQFDGFLGFSTDSETNNLKFDGYLDLLLSNNLNYGEQLALNYKSDGNDQQQLSIKTSLPYILTTPLGIELELKLFRRDTTFSETIQKASLFYQLGSRTKFTGGYTSRQSENLQDNITTTIALEDYDYQGGALGFSYIISSNRPLFQEETKFVLNTEAGKRTTTTEQTDQLMLNTSISHNFTLNPRNHIFLENNTQILFSESFLSNELFRFGGITSIRGFEENTITANVVTVLNTEYRYSLSNNLYVHSILDAAYFENELLNQKEQLFSIGFGAGILTKSGLLKLNIANGKSKDQSFQFSNTKVHLKLAIGF